MEMFISIACSMAMSTWESNLGLKVDMRVLDNPHDKMDQAFYLHLVGQKSDDEKALEQGSQLLGSTYFYWHM